MCAFFFNWIIRFAVTNNFIALTVLLGEKEQRTKISDCLQTPKIHAIFNLTVAENYLFIFLLNILTEYQYQIRNKLFYSNIAQISSQDLAHCNFSEFVLWKGPWYGRLDTQVYRHTPHLMIFNDGHNCHRNIRGDK